jgi:hypothetical protein
LQADRIVERLLRRLALAEVQKPAYPQTSLSEQATLALFRPMSRCSRQHWHLLLKHVQLAKPRMLVTGEHLSKRICQIGFCVNFDKPADVRISQLCYPLLPHVNMTQFRATCVPATESYRCSIVNSNLQRKID